MFLDMPEIRLNRSGQIDLRQRFLELYPSQPFPEFKSPTSLAYLNNPEYPYGDALTLHFMIRCLAPARIVEIGSGYSSCVTITTNHEFFQNRISFTMIEPNPATLRSLLIPEKQEACTLIQSKLQSVPLEVFTRLERNDILFIDTSHVSKLGSELHRLFFEIFPKLSAGVVIHIHDIFWPFEYPASWIEEGRAWNEAYLLRAFLQYNDSFEIAFWASFLWNEDPEWFRQHMPLYAKNAGCGIWLRKVG